MVADTKSYRRYNANIERALALFDPASEWADYIAFLTRLLKSLEIGKPEDLKDIPCKVRITLCLSRCLQPNLPSGVHQKALEVYNEIFNTIGLDAIAKDLSLYLPPLSHPLAFANLSTRPVVLDLYETYLLRLPASTLRPALKALILSLLPAIEEETSEDFDRSLQLFVTLKSRFSHDQLESYFWQTMFVASISNPQRRAGVLVFLTKYLPKLGTPPSHVDGGHKSHSVNGTHVVTTPEPGLLVRCFATGLRDEQVLVQRGFLDLLVTHLPLSTEILHDQAFPKDLDILMDAAVRIVLRKDMSLNRRLWTWLTGSDGKSAASQVTSPTDPLDRQLQIESRYFDQFGLTPLVRIIRGMAEDEYSDPVRRSMPFRILLSLIDKWEVAGPIVKSSFEVLFNRLRIYQTIAPSQEAFDEVFKSANTFFDAIESSTLLACLESLLIQDRLDLLSFVLSNFDLSQSSAAQSGLIAFCATITQYISSAAESRVILSEILNDILTVVVSTNASDRDNTVHSHVLSLLSTISEALAVTTRNDEDENSMLALCSSFEKLNAFRVVNAFSQAENPYGDLTLILQNLSRVEANFIQTSICARLVSSVLMTQEDAKQDRTAQYLPIITQVIQNMWQYLCPATPQYHIAVVESLWRMHDLTFSHTIAESSILSALACPGLGGTGSLVEFMERWTIFYQHSRTIKRAQDESNPPLLSTVSLRLLDSVSLHDEHDSRARWLLSIPTTIPILKAILESGEDDAQCIVLTVARIQKLIFVLRRSEPHWKSFSKSQDLQQCYAYLISQTSSARGQVSTRKQCLLLLTSMFNEQSGNTAPEDFVSFLIETLSAAHEDDTLQENVLDSLLSILNDKTVLPPTFTKVLIEGLDNASSDDQLEKWVTLLCNFLPHHATLLPNLLKVTSSFCKRTEQSFEDIKQAFSKEKSSTHFRHAERLVANLLSGLEYILARAHQQVSHDGGASKILTNGTAKEPVSARALANDRLTVILCMQDAIKVCTRLWSWKSISKGSTSSNKSSSFDSKSFQYIALRLRARCRRMLENLIEAEPQECLETLMETWIKQDRGSILELLQTLNRARPRAMLPAISTAISSRSNISSTNVARKSTLTIELDSNDLVTFLMSYISALEDDMLEEIWSDCTTLIREVLANPMPYRQILLQLLEFCAELTKKMENTNFGEESRKHRELADLIARLFTAIFTVKPSGIDTSIRSSGDTHDKAQPTNGDISSQASPTMSTICAVMPTLGTVLAQYNQLTNVFQGIVVHFVGPALHARAFPASVNHEHLELMQVMASSTGNAKTWRKEVLDSFNNAYLFRSSRLLAKDGWLPLFRQLAVNDKPLLSDCISKIAPPAAAGIMFGVGATAARTEADRKTQLEIRKIATLLLALETDAVLPSMRQLVMKVEELLTATPESSPSLSTRGDVYLLFRALLLRVSHSNLTNLWPIITNELQTLCTDMLAGSGSKLSSFSKLQGAKLLDLLLLLRPDEFQLHEWLFVTDTIDAVYPPNHLQSSSYADEIAPMLAADLTETDSTTTASNVRAARKPWLGRESSRNRENVESLLADFFGQLSIRVFEDLYDLRPPDVEACHQDLLADVFNDVDPL